MSLITLPAGLRVADFAASIYTSAAAFSSPFGGSEQVVDLLNDRWMFSLSITPTTRTESGAVEAFIAALRGGVNHTELHHFARPVPQGTLAGVVTAQATAQGAGTVVLNATTGQTLRAGDLFGVGGLLLQVAADCTAVAGAISVPIVNRLRVALASGAAVTLTRPTVPMRLVGAPGLTHRPGFADGMSLDFVEKVDA